MVVKGPRISDRFPTIFLLFRHFCRPNLFVDSSATWIMIWVWIPWGSFSMKRVTEASSHLVKWKGSWEYTLQARENVIGTLHLKGGDVTQAMVESAHGNWRSRKKWFPREKVILYQDNSGIQLAVFKTGWGREKDVLEFTDGHVYHWLSKNVWRNKCVFTAPSESTSFTSRGIPILSASWQRPRVTLQARWRLPASVFTCRSSLSCCCWDVIL